MGPSRATWGMFPAWIAVVAAYAWLGLCVWVLSAPHNAAPGIVKASCVGCWLAVGFWVWERTERVSDGYGHGGLAAGAVLFGFVFTLFVGALAVCIAGPIALWRRTR